MELCILMLSTMYVTCRPWFKHNFVVSLDLGVISRTALSTFGCTQILRCDDEVSKVSLSHPVLLEC